MELANSWCLPYEGDRAFARQVMERHPTLPCTGAYSINYAAESRAESASILFFLEGNDLMRRRYPKGLPWHQAETPARG